MLNRAVEINSKENAYTSYEDSDLIQIINDINNILINITPEQEDLKFLGPLCDKIKTILNGLNSVLPILSNGNKIGLLGMGWNSVTLITVATNLMSVKDSFRARKLFYRNFIDKISTRNIQIDTVHRVREELISFGRETQYSEEIKKESLEKVDELHKVIRIYQETEDSALKEAYLYVFGLPKSPAIVDIIRKLYDILTKYPDINQVLSFYNHNDNANIIKRIIDTINSTLSEDKKINPITYLGGNRYQEGTEEKDLSKIYDNLLNRSRLILELHPVVYNNITNDGSADNEITTNARANISSMPYAEVILSLQRKREQIFCKLYCGDRASCAKLEPRIKFLSSFFKFCDTQGGNLTEQLINDFIEREISENDDREYYKSIIELYTIEQQKTTLSQKIFASKTNVTINLAELDSYISEIVEAFEDNMKLVKSKYNEDELVELCLKIEEYLTTIQTEIDNKSFNDLLSIEFQDTREDEILRKIQEKSNQETEDGLFFLEISKSLIPLKKQLLRQRLEAFNEDTDKLTEKAREIRAEYTNPGITDTSSLRQMFNQYGGNIKKLDTLYHYLGIEIDLSFTLEEQVQQLEEKVRYNQKVISQKQRLATFLEAKKSGLDPSHLSYIESAVASYNGDSENLHKVIDKFLNNYTNLRFRSFLYGLKAELYDIERGDFVSVTEDEISALCNKDVNIKNICDELKFITDSNLKNILYRYLQEFLTCENKQDKYELFKQKFIARLNSCDYDMAKQDKKWYERKLTIILAICTLGIALGVSYAYTQMTYGHAYLFWEKTKKQESSQRIVEALPNLIRVPV